MGKQYIYLGLASYGSAGQNAINGWTKKAVTVHKTNQTRIKVTERLELIDLANTDIDDAKDIVSRALDRLYDEGEYEG